MAAANVRISPEIHETLKRLASEENESMQTVLAKAVESYRRARFLDAANAAYAELRKRPKEWKAELAERKLWDRTLGDGLSE